MTSITHCIECRHYDEEEMICTLAGDEEFPYSYACEDGEPKPKSEEKSK
jgi:hypothetical protein